ncbi:MAG: hypothetical protein OXH27_00210 [Gammaproteobacteria bacterium]|nr:hypothetical protein [Gammaproteobacteria bacterium]
MEFQDQFKQSSDDQLAEICCKNILPSLSYEVNTEDKKGRTLGYLPPEVFQEILDQYHTALIDRVGEQEASRLIHKQINRFAK